MNPFPLPQDVAADVLLSTQLFLDNTAEELTVFTEINAFRASIRAKQITRYFRTPRVLPQAAENKIQLQWERANRRKKRLLQSLQTALPAGDPLSAHVKNAWKKSERAMNEQGWEALSEWLSVEAGVWEAYRRVFATSALTPEDSQASAAPELTSAPALGTTVEPGIYNKQRNAQEFRQWFFEHYGQAAHQWESIWTSFFCYWKDTEPDPIPLEFPSEPESGAR